VNGNQRGNSPALFKFVAHHSAQTKRRDHDDIDIALKSYNTERQPIGNNIVLHGRKLGTHLGVNLSTEEDRRMHDLLQSDGAMLDWIAVPNFLDAYK